MIDRKGTENQVADHLLRSEDEAMRELWDKNEFFDTFPIDHVLADLQICELSVNDNVPPDISFHQSKKFMYDVNKFFGAEPYLYKSCADGIIRCCVPKVEMLSVLEACNSSPVGGHHSGI